MIRLRIAFEGAGMGIGGSAEWLQDPEFGPALVVIASVLAAGGSWCYFHVYRRRLAGRREDQRAQRELSYRSFVDALKGVMAAIGDEVLASQSFTEGLSGSPGGHARVVGPTDHDKSWQDSVRLDSDQYMHSMAHLNAATEGVEMYGSARARGLAVGLRTAAEKAGEGHTRRTHHESLQRLLIWRERGKDRFEHAYRDDVDN